jgi:uncharacterized phage-associated protein
MDNWFMAFKEYGLVGVIMFAVIALLFFVVKWTLQTTRDIMVQAAKEREAWQAAIGNVNDCIKEHTSQARAFHEQVNEAHKFQREEHKEMITTLGRINGYKA